MQDSRVMWQSRTAYRIAALTHALRGAVFVPALVLTSGLAQAQTTAQNSEQHHAVLAVVMTLFDGMRNRDAALIVDQFLPGARLGETTVADFATRVASSGAYLDEVTFDETIRVDGDLAMAWTPYNLFVDGHFHHCGVDLFVMKRSDDRWRISQLEDTRRVKDCDTTRGSPAPVPARESPLP